MLKLINEAAEIQTFLEEAGKEFFFVGGIALQIWGQPRLTTDIDLTVFTELTNEDDQVRWLLSHYKHRFPTSEEALSFSRTNRVVLLETASKTGIDLMLGGLADLSGELERASYMPFTPEISLKVCSAETLIAMKTVAGRSKDLADLESVLIKQQSLDWDYIDAYLAVVEEYKDISIAITALKNLKKEYYRT